MARDVNDIVAWGFGSWSDVTGLPTMGFGSGQTQSVVNLGYTADGRLHYTADGRLHYTADGRLQYKAKVK